MSANNWTTCPQCLERAQKEKQEQAQAAKDGYGKLPPEKYEALLIASRKPIALDPTLRENYHFYMSEEGDFSARYCADCSQCNFSFEFNHKQNARKKEG